MIEMNISPYKTSKNYGVNSVFIDEKILKEKIEKFDGFSIKSASECKFLSYFDRKTTNMMAEKLANQIENYANFVKEIVISSSQKNPHVFDFDLDKGDFVGGIKILTGCDVCAKVILKFHSTKKSYSNSVIKFVCEKNSQVEALVMFDFENESANFVCFEAVTAENSNLFFNVIDFGCKVSLQNFHSNVYGENSSCKLSSAYLGDNEDLIDLLYHQDIFGKNCTASIDGVGVLNKNAKKNFRSVISFEKGCKKSTGEENEFCLLLSDSVKSKALPMLLCQEEDVDGKHSTSIGRADEKQLFYLMSRGIEREEALKLIVKAKFNDFVSNLFDESLKEEIYEKIYRKL